MQIDQIDNDLFTSFISLNKDYKLLSLIAHEKEIDISSYDEFTEVLQSKVKSCAIRSISQYIENFENDSEKDEDDYFDSETEADVMIENKEYEIYASIIRKAITHYLMFNKNKNNEILNAILITDFKGVVNSIKKNTKFANFIINNYLQFIYKYFSKKINDDLIAGIQSNNEWLLDIANNIGIQTINDKARNIIINMYENLFSYNISEEIKFKILDDYFLTSSSNEFILAEFPNLINAAQIKALKNYQLKLIFADSYLSLKSWLYYDEIENEEDTELSEDEIYLLNVLEEAIIHNNYQKIFNNVELLHEIYNNFLVYNDSDYKREIDMSLLQENDNIKILKKVNPLYFLDRDSFIN